MSKKTPNPGNWYEHVFPTFAQKYFFAIWICEVERIIQGIDVKIDPSFKADGVLFQKPALLRLVVAGRRGRDGNDEQHERCDSFDVHFFPPALWARNALTAATVFGMLFQ